MVLQYTVCDVELPYPVFYVLFFSYPVFLQKYLQDLILCLTYHGLFPYPGLFLYPFI